MDTDLPYRMAARCEPCDMRAVLGEAHAARLAAVSAGRLVAYPCPVGAGWHVRNAGRPGR